MFHLALHLVVPAIITGVFFRQGWKVAYGLMLGTMLVDIDHLFANPVYDPNRCSIGFHPLHQLWAIAFYLVLCFVPSVRIIGIGLTIHMALDALDCQVTSGIWTT